MKKNVLFILSSLFAFSFYQVNAQIITTVAGNGTQTYTGDGGTATNAGVNKPSGVALDGLGNMYIVEPNDDVVRKVNSAGIITTIAGKKDSSGYSGDGGKATDAKLNNPLSIAVDAAGNLYIADVDNYRVRKVSTNGIINTFAGNGVEGYSGDGGLATNATLATAVGIAVDAIGNVFIAESYNNVIRMVNTIGIISTIAGTDSSGKGAIGYTGDGGFATNATLNDPGAVYVDAVGNIFISDYGNNVIRKVNTSGIITTVAGNGTYGFSGDGGPATDAQLFYPNGVAVDASGTIFISDIQNKRIRKVNVDGTISTIAGNGVEADSGDGGLAINAEIAEPLQLCIDLSGNLYIADLGNCVRKITNAAQVGIQEVVSKTNTLKAWPNPASQIIQLTSNAEKTTDLHIIDLLGNEVMQLTMQAGKLSLDISSLQPGVYFIQSGRGTQKFIKQ
jgi:sugar lactone lactonase YvrE